MILSRRRRAKRLGRAPSGGGGTQWNAVTTHPDAWTFLTGDHADTAAVRAALRAMPGYALALEGGVNDWTLDATVQFGGKSTIRVTGSATDLYWEYATPPTEVGSKQWLRYALIIPSDYAGVRIKPPYVISNLSTFEINDGAFYVDTVWQRGGGAALFVEDLAAVKGTTKFFIISTEKLSNSSVEMTVWKDNVKATPFTISANVTNGIAGLEIYQMTDGGNPSSLNLGLMESIFTAAGAPPPYAGLEPP